MSVPSKEYSWDYQLNNVVDKPTAASPSALFDAYNKLVLIKIVDLLLAADSVNGSAWTHVASSVGTAINLPSPNTGDTGATLGWTTGNLAQLSFGSAIAGSGSGSPGNWIVLKKANFFGSESPAYLTLALGSNGALGQRTCTLFLSRTRPEIQSGSTNATARPINTEGEIVYRTGMVGLAGPSTNYPAASFAIGGVSSVPAGAVWSTLTSGAAYTSQMALAPTQMIVSVARHSQGFRVLVLGSGKVLLAGIVEIAQGVSPASSSEMIPAVCFWDSRWINSSALPTESPLLLTRLWKERRVRMSNTSGSNFECYLTQETYGDGTAPKAITEDSTANSITSEYPMMPVGVHSNATGFVGRHGYLKDLYWGSENFKAEIGASYPDDGSRDWVQFGSLIFPWDTGEPVTLT